MTTVSPPPVPRAAPTLCSATSLARDEPMVGTASRVDRWLLIEHRGAWGPPALPTARLPAQLAAHLTAAAAAQRARLLLIRRPHGVPCPPGRQVYLVDSRPGNEQVRTRQVTDDGTLAHLTLDGSGPGWRPEPATLVLVCTHGRHDRCCAIRGRPVAAALSARRPDHVWECSHTGGDRFAANVLVLPFGLYLGRVPDTAADALLADLDEGLVPTGYVRGRSSLSLPAQAAQQFARVATRRHRLDDLAPVRQRATSPDTWTVDLTGPGGPDVEVTVFYDRRGDGHRHQLTCGATEPRTAPLFRRLSLR